MAKIEDEKEELKYYLDDWDLLLLWKLNNPNLHSGDGLLFIRDVEAVNNQVIDTLQDLDELLKKIGIKHNLIAAYTNNEIEMKGIEESVNDPEKKNKKAQEALENLRKNNFTLKDLEILEYHLNFDLDEELYVDVEFSKKNKEKLSNFLSTYIDRFINHELLILTKSVLVFEKQKDWFIDKIKSMKAIENYWKNFVISRNRWEDFEILYYHTLYALEKLGYIKVMALWHTYEGNSRKQFFANIIIDNKLIEEINTEFKKTNPGKYIEKFDSKMGILSFGGKKIELSKSGKETDPVLLMKTLLKKEEWEWVHNDEIFEDWGIREDEQVSKNKIYFALQKINTIMKLSVQIWDLIEWGTKKARINPKYRKVDK